MPVTELACHTQGHGFNLQNDIKQLKYMNNFKTKAGKETKAI